VAAVTAREDAGFSGMGFMQFKKYSTLMLLAGALVFQPLWAAEQSSTSEKPASGKAPDRSPRVPTFKVNGDLAGRLGVFTTRYEDTFAEVGSQLALGYLELVKAFKGLLQKKREKLLIRLREKLRKM
jgi:L,D-transpeptidase ErfK/SrfK